MDMLSPLPGKESGNARASTLKFTVGLCLSKSSTSLIQVIMSLNWLDYSLREKKYMYVGQKVDFVMHVQACCFV